MKSAAPTSPKRNVTARTVWAWTVATFLLVAAVDVAVLAYVRSTSPNPTYRTIRAKWKIFLGIQEPVDWLIIGDSSANNGVVTRIVEEKLGGRAINVATLGAAAAINQAWMMRLYLDRFPPPRGVIAVNSINVGLKNCQKSMIAQIPMSYRTLAALEPPPFETRAEWVHAFIDKYIPLYAENVTLGTLIRTPWRLDARREEFDPIPPDGWAPRRHHQGDEFSEEGRAAYLAEIADAEPMSACVEAGFAELARLAESCQVPVYFANTPQDTDVLATETYRDFRDRVRKRMEAYAAGRSYFHYLPPATPFRPEEFYTRDHLLEGPARAFTQELAQRVYELAKNAAPTKVSR